MQTICTTSYSILVNEEPKGCLVQHIHLIMKVLKAMDHMVTPEMNHHLIQPYIVEEVKRALFQMHPSKSLGSDDMSPFFFQKY